MDWATIVGLAEGLHSTTTGELPPLYAGAGALPDEVVVPLVKRCATRYHSDPRKREQAIRERMRDSTYGEDIERYIGKLYSQPFAEKINPHVTTVANVFEDIASQVVQLYRGQTLRRIDGISDTEQEAFAELVRETKIDATAQRMAETAWGVGPQHVIPVIRRGRFRFLAPSPSTTDEVLDSYDPTGAPVAVAFPAGGGRVVVIDGVSYRVFVLTPEGVVEDTSERVEHNRGDTTVATLRFDEPIEPYDWHMRDRNRRIVEANLVIGHLLAKLNYVRKAQGAKLLTVVGNLDGVARGQAIGDPNGPLLARTDTESPESTQTTEIAALDFDTPPERFIAQIRHHTEWAAESTGVPVTVTAGGDKFDIEFDFDRLAELRGQLAWWAETWERELWTYTIALAKTSRHRLATQLPSPDKVEAGFFLQLPPMHRKFASPKEERDHWDWMMKGGLASVLDKGRRYMGNRSDKAIVRQIEVNLAINGRYWDEVAKRQAPAMLGTNGEVKTLAQAQGALGPAARDRQALPPGGDDDNPTQTEAGG